MINRIVCCGGLLGLLFLAGCDAMQSRTEKRLRAFIAATNDLSDTLAAVRDHDSAEASLAVLDEKYSKYLDAARGLSDVDPNAKASQATVNEVTRDIGSSTQRFNSELLRVRDLRGLPPQFWKLVTTRSLELMDALLTSMPTLAGTTVSQANVQLVRDVRDLIDRCGFEQTLNVHLANVPPHLVQAACDRLLKLAPGAKLCHATEGTEERIFLGPVKDFHAFVVAVDLGTVVFEDDSQRVIKIAVNRRKLGERGNSVAKETNPVMQEQVAIQQRDLALRQARIAEEWAAREKERRGPDPSDPDYYDKMADRLASSNVIYRREAMDVLLNTDPADVTSVNAKKKIARAFKKLAEEDHFDRGKAIKGLVIWGGKYSVPILLKLLKAGHSFDEETIITALGELKDPQAAPALAARLGHFHLNQIAFDALNEMGSGAEDAVREVGMTTEDNKIYMQVIALLGNVGTEKSLAFLERAQSSRDRPTRLAARTAAQKINVRKRQAKKDNP